MDPRMVALKLLLDALGVKSEPDSFEARKRLQKAVYLAQQAGGDLGYRFGWYIHGPYSPQLTQDYFGLSEAIDEGDKSYEGHELTDEYQAKLKKLIADWGVQVKTGLSQLSWLELLASVHFLERSSRLNFDDAKKILDKQKPDLAPFAALAQEQLKKMSLL